MNRESRKAQLADMPAVVTRDLDGGKPVSRRRSIAAVRHCATFVVSMLNLGDEEAAVDYAHDAMRIAQAARA